MYLDWWRFDQLIIILNKIVKAFELLFSCDCQANMTSDSDSDYSDAEEISQVEIANHADREKQVNADGVNVHGNDVNWVNVYS